MAASDNVKIARVEPSRASTPPKPITDLTGPEIRQAAFTIDLSGPYDAVCGFLDHLDRDLGMSRVVSWRLGPSHDSSGFVEAAVETSHLETPASMREGR